MIPNLECTTKAVGQRPCAVYMVCSQGTSPKIEPRQMRFRGKYLGRIRLFQRHYYLLKSMDAGAHEGGYFVHLARNPKRGCRKDCRNKKDGRLLSKNKCNKWDRCFLPTNQHIKIDIALPSCATMN